MLCRIEFELDGSCCMKWHGPGVHEGVALPSEATSISPTSADIPPAAVVFQPNLKERVTLYPTKLVTGIQKISGQPASIEPSEEEGNTPAEVKLSGTPAGGCILAPLLAVNV